jgi:tetratricopeptide (TPR) repeat protein
MSNDRPGIVLSASATAADRALVRSYEEKIQSLMAARPRRIAGAIKRALGLPHQTYEEYIAKLALRWRGGPGPARTQAAQATKLSALPLPVPIPVEEIPARLDAADFPGIADAINAVLMQRNVRSTAVMLDHLSSRGKDERYASALLYAEIRFADQLSLFSRIPAAAEKLLRRAHLERLLGKKARDTVMATRARALVRLGRYEEGLEAIDRALWNDPADIYLLGQKAEIAWARSPQVALEALATASSAGKLAGSTRMLYRAIAEAAYPQALQEEVKFFNARSEDLPQEFQLLFANMAAAYGDLSAQRRHFDRYFAMTGLGTCILSPWLPVEFANLGNASLASAPDGPLVSVLMTTFNSAATVAQAVQSILDQTHRNLELLVVDDGSTDETVAILGGLAARDRRIRILLNARNSGTYVSKNRALAEASGEFFTCQDSDDWSHPQRIAGHLEAMSGHRQLVATRSRWFRMSGGMIEMRRWRNCFAHASPTSTFCRMQVREEIGYFDSVRTGADSEHWFRIRSRYGPSAALSMSATLSIGSQRADSLTRSGAAAMSEENYSPVRELYCEAWVEWQRAQAESLDLHLPAFQKQRRFPAPAEMLVAEEPGDRAPATLEPALPGRLEVAARSAGDEVVFGISLAARSVVEDWTRTCLLLSHTLRSVLAQTDPRVRVLLCGHDRPALAELDDPRVEFLVSDQEPARSPKDFRRDKMRKRALVAMRLRELGGGYLLPLDADDLVSNRLVAHVLSDDNRRGYLITQGYVLDWNNRRLACIPGAWDAPYDRVCGSSAVLYFETSDLPAPGEPTDATSYFDLFREHAYWPITAEEFGRPLARIPFPAGIYVLNHGQNLSFQMQRTSIRQRNIAASIEKHQQPISTAIIHEFNLPTELGNEDLFGTGQANQLLAS